MSHADEIIAQGTRIGDDGRYVIGTVIALGGMGAVYHARDLRLGDVCAVKAMPTAGRDQADVETFHREAKLLGAMRHPGVVAVRDNFDEIGHAFLVMDLVPGLNLYDLHKREPEEGDDPDDLPLMRLPECWTSGLLWPDVGGNIGCASSPRTPPIIYIETSSRIILSVASMTARLGALLDFGIARFSEGNAQIAEDEPLGTPGYAAPEQYMRDGQSDARTDIYELGVVLLELATGYNPRNPNAPKALPPPREIRPEMSPNLARILERCIDVDRDRRYPNAEALLAELSRWRPSAARTSPGDLDAEEPNWTFDLGAPITSAAFATSTTVYYADNDGMVCALNPQTGEPFWLHHEGPEGISRTAIRIAASITKFHRLLAYTFANPVESDKVPQLGVGLIEARSGKPIWRTKTALGRAVIPLVTDTAMLICAVTEPNELVGMSLHDPSLGWRRPLESSPLSCVKAPSVEGRPEVCLIGDRSGMLRAYICEDGRSLWSTRVMHGPLVAPPLIARDRIYLGGVRGDTSFAGVVLRSGEILWKRPLTGEVIGVSALVFEADVLVIPTRNAGLIGLKPDDGAKLWHDVGFSRTLTGAVQMPGSPIVAITRFGPGSEITLVDVENEPTVQWRSALDSEGAISPAVVSSNYLVAAAADGLVRGWRVK